MSLILAAGLAVFAAGAHAKAPTGFYGCRSFVSTHPAPIVRPRSIVIACGDANLYLTGIGWRTWKASSASGRGTLHQNDCSPSCAAGHFRTTTASITLGRPRGCKGAQVFTRIAWSVHGKTQSLDYGCGP